MKKLRDQFVKLTAKNRLYQLDRPIIGLTGGIGTGKSTVAKILEQEGFFLISADLLVKEIYAQSEGLEFVKQHYPQCLENHQINFKKLRELAFSSIEVKNNLEGFIYQRLPAQFKKKAAERPFEAIIYDVPLLFEKKLDTLVDLKVCVYCNRKTQIERIVNRDQVTVEIAQKILDHQMDIEQKKQLCDRVISNQGTELELKEQVQNFITSYFA